ncbi:oxygen-independent coproporphyrinogen III oxidase [Marinicella sp. S1101]|uniref:oxygen-independent coproporphyrinogen III oxidase n=1 Tax=Marinicella marina TaxID=2996016 RepID=UPI0022610450|nr:oxygen-independent coproporphyrinogen III oxidase [Marinicella marina]MCX7554140.1 oxygen-independent coproporphyrinogen III oxidase [Marinicella marina]MDJ1141167.1 oxygen-independent coproporphyrinogen III oxidase [Marinicella marina]
MTSINSDSIVFDLDLIHKYNLSGPRYTSYPTAVVFNEAYDELQHRKNLMSYYDASHDKPLSLYFHIPFCDTLCFFCACNKIATKKRSKADIYLDYLEREIKLQAALIPASRVVEQMHFGGGTPTFLTHKQLKRMMAMIEDNFNLLHDDRRDYSIEIDPREAADETIQLLADLGFNRFSMGVQDVQEKVQIAVNRIQPIALTADAISMCRQNGAKSVNVDLIYGLPHQTKESFKNTLAQVIELSPDRLSVFNYAHMPHLFMPQKRIAEADLPAADEKLAILKMTIEDLTAAGYVYIGMDHFAKPDDELAVAQRNGQLQRNFQGYTTHAECDLVAMGVSAISLINNCFSQNVKTLDEYYAQLDQGHIPVMKGYALNEDDRLRKQVIQSLSCHFMLDTTATEAQYSINFEAYFSHELPQLQSMSEDGLLWINDSHIHVTAKGRLLIRNICMVFDQHLRKQTEQKFSKVI